MVLQDVKQFFILGCPSEFLLNHQILFYFIFSPPAEVSTLHFKYAGLTVKSSVRFRLSTNFLNQVLGHVCGFNEVE